MSRRKKDPSPDNPYIMFAAALNYFDPDQREMIEHIQKRTNFSAYFKRLVLRDMQGIVVGTPQNVYSAAEESLDDSLMDGII